MRSINVGDLVHRVLIQQREDVPVDDSGAPTDGGWTKLQYAQMSRAERRSDRVGEHFTGGQLSAQIVTQWTMRYLCEMDPDLHDVHKDRRLVYHGRAYDIVGVEVMDRKVGLVIRTIASSKVAA